MTLSKNIRGSRSKVHRRLLVGVALLSATVLSWNAFADDISALAARLAHLRSEVETLSQQLSSKSQETQDALRSLARQRADLELEVKREETRLQKISASIRKRKLEIDAEKAKGSRLVPLFESAYDQVRDHVNASLPFRKEERLSGLKKIKEQFAAHLLTPARALQRLWSFVEDENRMTRESGLFKQSIEVDGEVRLAEVIRIGMIMLFYKTEGGSVGRVAQRDGKWVFEPIEDQEDKRRVRELFVSFKKQIRVGYFELPYALATGVTTTDGSDTNSAPTEPTVPASPASSPVTSASAPLPGVGQ